MCEIGAERRVCREVWRRAGRKRVARVRIRERRFVCVCVWVSGFEGLDWKRRGRE